MVAAGAAVVTDLAGVGPDGVEVGPAVVTAGVVVGSVAVTSAVLVAVMVLVVGSVVVPVVPARRAAPSCPA